MSSQLRPLVALAVLSVGLVLIGSDYKLRRTKEGETKPYYCCRHSHYTKSSPPFMSLSSQFIQSSYCCHLSSLFSIGILILFSQYINSVSSFHVSWKDCLLFVSCWFFYWRHRLIGSVLFSYFVPPILFFIVICFSYYLKWCYLKENIKFGYVETPPHILHGGHRQCFVSLGSDPLDIYPSTCIHFIVFFCVAPPLPLFPFHLFSPLVVHFSGSYRVRSDVSFYFCVWCCFTWFHLNNWYSFPFHRTQLEYAVSESRYDEMQSFLHEYKMKYSRESTI